MVLPILGFLTPIRMLSGRSRSLLRALAIACVFGLWAALIPLLPNSAHAEPFIKGSVKAYTEGGYARLMFHFDQAVDATVHVNGLIMVINFKKPIAVSADHLNEQARDYISAARSDPDGTAIRIALAHKVKVNTIPAGERFYVDLLPESWTGLLPGLPQEIIDELAQRARQAEKELREQRHQRHAMNEQEPSLVRVKVARQPTFIRYVFTMPDSANVVPESTKGKLTLNFDQKINWDLADALSVLPSNLISIGNKIGEGSSAVTFIFNGMPELHTFREDRSIVVDVVTGQAPIGSPSIENLKKQAAAPKATMSDKAMPVGEDKEKKPPQPVSENAEPKSPMARPTKAQTMATPPEVPAAPAAQATKASPSSPQAMPQEAGKDPQTSKALVQETMPAKTEPATSMREPTTRVESSNSSVTPPANRRPPLDARAPIVVSLRKSSERLQLDFPFVSPTPAAVFRRADTLWLVFDTSADIDIGALKDATENGIPGAVFERAVDGAAIVRLKLARPQLASAVADGSRWTITIADTATTPSQPLAIVRSGAGRNHAGIAITLDHPASLHKLRDPDAGDTLFVVTAPAPARGLLKQQDFLELRTLVSTHGVAVRPIADDLTAALEKDRLTISRPMGLSLSLTSPGQHDSPTYRAMTFDTQLWGFDRNAPFVSRQSELIRLAAVAPENKRRKPRLDLARFYLARGMDAEAKGVIDVALTDQKSDSDITGSILKAIANVMLNRPSQALKDLTAPDIRSQQDAPVWRAVALAREGKWAEAHEAFKKLDDIIAALPLELQRFVLREALRADIEMQDFTGAARLLNEFQAVGISPDLEASMQVLSGKLNEGLGRKDDALTDYRAAAASNDRPAAAQARLREIELMGTQDPKQRQEIIRELETLTSIWRGDETEAEGLKVLAHLYTIESRYRDAFHVMRTALLAHPNSDLTRKIQDEAAITFDKLFLDGKGDALPPIEALGLFYDFRELTPIGRRGDEMIRRLADRLVSVDLLQQAAELLQHQIDHRLQGAARAQVATKLATIYLMSGKPNRALASLHATRTSELSNDLRNQRLLLEARALSEQGRHEVALDLIDNLHGREVVRLRSDILWLARRWRKAAEQIEMLYGERWRDFTPLNDTERADVLRMAIGYALGDETIGLSRLREKYAAKMAEGPDRQAFDVVSAPIGTSAAEFQKIAKRVAATNTLDAFLREMRARYPDSIPGEFKSSAAKMKPKSSEPPPRPAMPEVIVPKKTERSAMNAPLMDDASFSPLPPTPPLGVRLRPDPLSTGSIRVLSRKRSAGPH